MWYIEKRKPRRVESTMLFAPTLNMLESEFETFDRGTFTAVGGVLSVTDGWVAARNVNVKHLSLTFSARAPEGAQQVQIWAGFRHFSRDYRYVVALRGGNNNHLYLGRMGAEGYDKMLALRPLEWSPMPGVWYDIRVVAAGCRIAVYLNGAEQPLICVEDTDAPFDGGSVAFGGSFLPTEFRDIRVDEVNENALDGVVPQADYLASVTMTPDERARARVRARAAYRPFALPRTDEARVELSLDGEWLFVPDYEQTGGETAVTYDDTAAHTIAVPSCWIPLQAWLEGENMRDLNKGMNDNYLVEEMTRCLNQTFDYRRTKSAVYRHYLDLPCGIESKRVVLDFEGVALISAIWFNGVRVRENIGMFTPMQVDVSALVHPGRNVIAVEVFRRLSEESENAVKTSTVDDNYATAWDILDAEEVETKCERRPFCTDDIAHGFYMNNPGGIWRSVKLIVSDKVHVDECFFVPTTEDATVEVRYTNSGADEMTVSLSYALVHRTTGEYLCGGTVEQCTLASGEQRVAVFTTPKVQPRLWGPGTPNLYALTFTLRVGNDVRDVYTETVGFRSVVFDGATLMYNGAPLWVRGGNHMPAHVRPNDRALARRFMQLALEHNLTATRTHVAPWGSAWLDAADEAGLLVSLEGTWSWLMLEHIPSKRSIKLWKEELAALIRRHRNRPSLFLMTMNNEMKFYLHDAPDEVVIEKGRILEGGVQVARALLPHLPLVCDSAYFRRHALRSGRYERIILAHGYDDGDMDDPHGYFGWYNPSFFHFMNGEFGRDYTVEGRPCMSQECATGYPRAEDGLPTRAYLYLHQTPQTTVGKKAYEYNDPRFFLNRHAMLTKEMAEMLRRVEHDRTCGVLLFAFETWFYHQHDAARIQPMTSARCLKTAYQPILASAELFGRHFTAGETLAANVTLINDANDRRTLVSPQVEVAVTAGETVLAQTVMTFESLAYFKTTTKEMLLPLPTVLPQERTEAKLVLKVLCDGVVVSQNEYDLLLAAPAWAMGKDSNVTYVCQKADTTAQRLLARYGISADLCEDLETLPPHMARVLVCGKITPAQGAALHAIAAQGGKVVLLDSGELPSALLGEETAVYTSHRQEIVTMNIPESGVYHGIEPLDIAWFGDGRRVPYVANGRYAVDRFSPDCRVMAETLEWHGYINHPTDYKKFGGTPLFVKRIGKGEVLVSALRVDACETDPVASRLTANILKWDFES